MLAHGADADVRHGPAAVALGDAARQRAAVADATAREPARPLRDATGKHRGDATSAAGTDAAALFDDTSGTEAATGGWVEYAFAGDARRDARFYTLTSGASDAAADPRALDAQGLERRRQVVEGPGHPRRRDVPVAPPDAAVQDRPAGRVRALPPRAAGRRRDQARRDRAPQPRRGRAARHRGRGRARRGPARPCRCAWTCGTTADASLGGDVSLAVPGGWTVSPAKRSFGPLATGRSQTLTFDVTVPAGVSARHVRRRGDGDARVRSVARRGGTVQVLGDTIEFSPGTSAEEPWLSEDGGSQLDGTAYDGRGRFTDNERFFVYRFELPADVTGGTLSARHRQRVPRRGIDRRLRTGRRC